MRNDMSQKLVERGRGGGVWAKGVPRSTRTAMRRARGNGAWDALPKREGINVRDRTKYPNENLAPLVRFLRRRCGQPWDKVYGELRAELSPNSVIHMHILQHLFEYVARHVELRSDGVWANVGSEVVNFSWRAGCRRQAA
jgi:hypothetical protein